MLLLVLLTFILISLILNLRLLFYISVLFSIVITPYLIIDFGALAINIQRIAVILLLISFCIYILKHTQKMQQLINYIFKYKYIILVVLLIYILKLISTVFAPNKFFITLIIEILSFPFMLIIGLMVFRNRKDIMMFLGILVISAFISEIMAIFEYLKGGFLFSGLVDTTRDFQETMTTGLFRNDTYRVTAGFSNPLILAEYLVIILPIALYIFLYSSLSKWIKHISLLTIILIPLIIYFTQSRTALVAFIIILIIIGYRKILTISKKNKILKMIPSFVIISSIIVSVYIISSGLAINILEDYLQKEQDISSIASIISRVNQYEFVIEMIKNSFVFGYGVQKEITSLEGFDGRALDNYYLRIALESGITTLLIFILLIYRSMKFINNLNKIASSGYDKHLIFSLSLSMWVIYLYLFFVSIPFNLMFAYIFIACLIVLHRLIIYETKTNK